MRAQDKSWYPVVTTRGEGAPAIGICGPILLPTSEPLQRVWVCLGFGALRINNSLGLPKSRGFLFCFVLFFVFCFVSFCFGMDTLLVC